VTQTLELPAGHWEISIQYDATQPLRVTAPAFSQTVPANLDYRGSVPYFPVGELTVPRRGPVRFVVAVDDPPALGRLLGTEAEAHLGAIAASPAAAGGPLPGEAERSVPLGRACGSYVDWYHPPANH
jgi:S-formylglutathione hydrolase FrmB